MPKLGSQSHHSYLKFTTTSSFLHQGREEMRAMVPVENQRTEWRRLSRSLSFYPVRLGGGGGDTDWNPGLGATPLRCAEPSLWPRTTFSHITFILFILFPISSLLIKVYLEVHRFPLTSVVPLGPKRQRCRIVAGDAAKPSRKLSSCLWETLSWIPHYCSGTGLLSQLSGGEAEATGLSLATKPV